MKTTIKSILKKGVVFIFLLASITSCEDYLDVNTPSGYLNEEDLEMKDLIGPVMYNTAYAYYTAETSFGNYTQYFGGRGFEAQGVTSNGSAWDYIFTRALPNIIIVKKKATNLGASHYKAVAEILEVMNMSLAVESWGDVPYSEAGKPFETPNPKLDEAATVYSQLTNLLSKAIAALEGVDNSVITIGNEDLFYKGDLDKWKRAAYTLKARMQLKMMNNGGATIDEVLSSINKGFISNADNMILDFPEGKINPYYAINILARNTSNYHYAPNDQIINMLNGNTYPFESGMITEDPRLNVIYENEGAAGDPWRGFQSGGSGNSGDGEPANTFYKDGGYHTNSTAPIVLLTYAEANFIKAEANFIKNGGTTTSTGTNATAYQAYMDGISASMNQIGVDGTTYMADSAVDVGEAGLMLNHIMKEKYIANIHSVETFNDMRRYNFSPDVFKGLTIRFDDGTVEYSGQWFRRAIYPASEADSNTNIQSDETTSIVNIWLFE